MSTLLATVIAYFIINALIAIPFMLRARTEFKIQGRWSILTAVVSGFIMHGHFLATLALAWLDHGSLYASTVLTMAVGAVLFIGGAMIIYFGRFAYGSQKRVYGLLEDELIQHGIYRRTRNPQYVGYDAMFLGVAIAAGSGLALLSAIAFIVIIHVFIT